MPIINNIANRLPVARNGMVSPFLRRLIAGTAQFYCYVAASQWIVAHLRGDAKRFFDPSISACGKYQRAARLLRATAPAWVKILKLTKRK